MYAGPHNKQSDLVFGYDLGTPDSNSGFRNKSRFFKGRPTANLGPISFGDWGTEGTAQRIATGNYFRGQPTYNCRSVVGESWRGIDKTISGLRTSAGSSGTVTMSCFVKNNHGTSYPMYAYIGHDFSSTRTIAANSNWQRVQWTVNQSSMNNDYVEFRPYTNDADRFLEMTMPQVEVNVGSATQWTATQRSNTGAILPLKGFTSINASTVSYDGQGYPEFDGTDDVINVDPGTFPSSFAQAFSIEVIYYVPSSADWSAVSGRLGCIVARGGYAGVWGLCRYTTNNRLGFYMRTGSGSTTYDISTDIERDKYYHILATWNGSNRADLYLNGVLMHYEVNSYTGTTCDNTGNIKIGGGISFSGSAGGFPEARIPVVKIYSSMLTLQQVKTNYLSYSRRFNL